jgi:hypothetical protein
LDGVSEDRTHAVLDLGPAASRSLRLYSGFARWVRFADLLSDAGRPRGWAAAIRALPEQPQRPYDLVFGWDILDRLFPEERPRLVERLAEVTAPTVRLHLLVDASDRPTRRPLRFTLLGADRMRLEPTGPERPAHRKVLPAEVERLLEPFQVARAFTLKSGLREYVAMRGEGRELLLP